MSTTGSMFTPDPNALSRKERIGYRTQLFVDHIGGCADDKTQIEEAVELALRLMALYPDGEVGNAELFAAGIAAIFCCFSPDVARCVCAAAEEVATQQAGTLTIAKVREACEAVERRA